MEDANAFLEQLVASGKPLPKAHPRTPLEKAQAITYEAWEADTPQEAIRLARKALSISKDCADAYTVLASAMAGSLEETKELFAKGVEAGERALGEEAFSEYEGRFWGVVETRPYMRARQGLAACLWEMGQRTEATDHYQEMLRLNPGDNQGIRYTLLICLLEDAKEKEAAQLLKAYDDDASALWLYSAALLSFKKRGADRTASQHLADALEFNPHVPTFLLGRRPLPQELPLHLGFGDENEAINCVLASGHLWLREPGAIEWLRQLASDLF